MTQQTDPAARPAAQPIAGRPPAAERLRRPLILAAGAVLAAGVVVVVRHELVEPLTVASASMQPTLCQGDVVLVDRRPVGPEDLSRGDLVTFTSPQDGERALKRVVGLPGDRVVIKDAVLHVNEVPVDEPWVDHERIDAYYSRTFVVPEHSVFVLGDNRGNSTDSRDYGPVDADQLTGRVLVRLWPPVRG